LQKIRVEQDGPLRQPNRSVCPLVEKVVFAHELIDAVDLAAR
jgi:hypothetical protein